ncbi:MAG TPA: hypothetical protein VER11_11390 [Polyangiaceae bacterium]|nr:hypothetical protein [Polyangiaceae bacterium]
MAISLRAPLVIRSPLAALTLSLAVSACSPSLPSQPASDPSHTELPSQFRNKCDAAKGQLQPLIVEWSAPDRATLEAQARHAQLVVHYEGCQLEVLRACTVPAKFAYKYTAITPKDELVTMNSADQLYASIPVHAASFEGKLAQKGQLNAAMTIVGMYEAPNLAPAVDQLVGECGRATHVVSALTVGAFEFFAGSALDAGANLNVLGAAAGGEHQSNHETLSRDGNVKACVDSKRGDAEPPENCGALLRLELAALRAAGIADPECGPGTVLVDHKCKAVEKPSTLAPEDQNFVDDKNGAGWGNRCYSHLKSGALPYARAACAKALEANPEPRIRGMILYNLALIDEATPDPKAACEWLRQSASVRPGVGAVQEKFDALKCRELLAH